MPIDYNLVKFMEDIEMRKMFFLGVFLLMFLINSTAIAHPPSEVAAEFDLESNILSVEVVHSVGGDPVHFMVKRLLFSKSQNN